MVNLADIVGPSAAAPVAAPSVNARMVQLAVTGAGTVRYGGPNVSSVLGMPLTSTDGVRTLPYLGPDFNYGLGGFYAYVPAGATLSVGYEPYD